MDASDKIIAQIFEDYELNLARDFYFTQEN